MLRSYFLLITTCFASGLIFDYPCFEPCMCPQAFNTNPTVNCSSIGLTAIPSFEGETDPFNFYPAAGDRYTQKYIYFEKNAISNIPANAFSRIARLYQGNNLTISLAHNAITSVHPMAFADFNDHTIILNINNNRLTTLPEALRSIVNLKGLDISQNPLVQLSDGLMTHLAPNLRSFGVTLDSMPEKPTALALLRATSLSIEGLREIQQVDTLQVDGHINDLSSLSIIFSELTELSSVPCRFPNLKRLTLIENYSLVPQMFRTCDTSEELALDSLEIRDCDLSSIEIVMYWDVRYVSFQGNLLGSVPQCVARTFQNAVEINLMDNDINQIVDTDFQNLVRLESLTMTNNPLSTISAAAFATNNIKTLLLRGTMLRTISNAIRDLDQSATFLLPLSSLECTCDNMASLANWPVGHQAIQGVVCSNNDKELYDYIVHDVPKCPTAR